MIDAFRSNWIAPLGPHVDAFEAEFANVVGSDHAVAVSSGTAALHLALLSCGIGSGDEVLVSSLTFSATINAICYVGAIPVLIDSEPGTWNMDPVLLSEAISTRVRAGRAPRAVIPVHLYGQSADMDRILDVCDRHGIAVIEDAAEALGASYKGRAPGSIGKVGIFSFNGNKIITTSGGGMVVSDSAAIIDRARKLATQAREPAPHYEHTEVGYNYRLSNILAAIGRGQLSVLEDRVLARRRIFAEYADALKDLPGVSFMPEQTFGDSASRATRWLTCITIAPAEAGLRNEDIRLSLSAENIECRPVWKPMHLQPAFRHFPVVGGNVSAGLFETGLCLPSGSALTSSEQARVVSAVRGAILSANGNH